MCEDQYSNYCCSICCFIIYKPAFSEAKTLELIQERAGSHFDPMVFEAFMESYDEIEEVRTNINTGALKDMNDICKIDLDSGKI